MSPLAKFIDKFLSPADVANMGFGMGFTAICYGNFVLGIIAILLAVFLRAIASASI
jgi:ubiquinone/menaquinone biosynthesis C-methylase UbiE